MRRFRGAVISGKRLGYGTFRYAPQKRLFTGFLSDPQNCRLLPIEYQLGDAPRSSAAIALVIATVSMLTLTTFASSAIMSSL